MPKISNKYPYNISAAVTPKLRRLIDNEMELSSRSLSEIIREALYEYFEIEEDEENPRAFPITITVTPLEAERLHKLGYTYVATQNSDSISQSG